MIPLTEGRLAPAGEYRVRLACATTAQCSRRRTSPWWRRERRADGFMSALGAQLLATRLPGAGTIAAALAVALAVIAVLVLVMRRHADAFPLLAVFALPFRVPISTDGRTVNLLVPLYLVVAAGTCTYLLPRWLALLGAGSRGEPAARGENPTLRSWSSWLTAARHRMDPAGRDRPVRAAERLLGRPREGGREPRLLLPAVRAAVPDPAGRPLDGAS